MPSHRLTVAKVKSAAPGRYLDGRGLRLHVSKTGAKNWVFRYMLNRRSREMGLGGFPDTTLAEARAQAAEARRLVKRGIDPIEHREVERREAQGAKGLTFRSCAETYIEDHHPGWKNAKHAAQ